MKKSFNYDSRAQRETIEALMEYKRINKGNKELIDMMNKEYAKAIGREGEDITNWRSKDLYDLDSDELRDFEFAISSAIQYYNGKYNFSNKGNKMKKKFSEESKVIPNVDEIGSDITAMDEAVKSIEEKNQEFGKKVRKTFDELVSNVEDVCEDCNTDTLADAKKSADDLNQILSDEDSGVVNFSTRIRAKGLRKLLKSFAETIEDAIEMNKVEEKPTVVDIDTLKSQAESIGAKVLTEQEFCDMKKQFTETPTANVGVEEVVEEVKKDDKPEIENDIVVNFSKTLVRVGKNLSKTLDKTRKASLMAQFAEALEVDEEVASPDEAVTLDDELADIESKETKVEDENIVSFSKLLREVTKNAKFASNNDTTTAKKLLKMFSEILDEAKKEIVEDSVPSTSEEQVVVDDAIVEDPLEDDDVKTSVDELVNFSARANTGSYGNFFSNMARR